MTNVKPICVNLFPNAIKLTLVSISLTIVYHCNLFFIPVIKYKDCELQLKLAECTFSFKMTGKTETIFTF